MTGHDGIRVQRIPVPRHALAAWIRHLSQQGLDSAEIAEVLGLDEAEVQSLLEGRQAQP
jgi:predicted XRE-type DNA-binding protein